MSDRISSTSAAWIACIAFAGLLAGCPRTGGPAARHDGETTDDTWVVFDVVERGSGAPLLAYVWVDGYHDDFETVISGAENEARFAGFGRGADGYVVPFGHNQRLRFLGWSPDHEVAIHDSVLKRGENLISLELRRTEVDDERVPEQIRLDVLNRLPTEKPKTGS